MSAGERPLIIACGALVSELREVLNRNGLADAVEVRYLPANLHNRPEGIVPALREHLDARGSRSTFIGYADCGTGGQIDTMLLKCVTCQPTCTTAQKESFPRCVSI